MSRNINTGMSRRGGRTRDPTYRNRQASPPPPRPFGDVIDTIDIKSLLIEESAPKIEDSEYLASYNWLEGKTPIILVPGSPPAWTPPHQEVVKLRGDSNSLQVFRDINSAHYAAYPMEPAIRAILAQNPEYDLPSVDIIGCGSTLGNLLRFASNVRKPFRFDVDLIGDTAFLIRREASPTEVIEGLRGYGHTFPERYTTWGTDVKNSCSHQRIVHYVLGGLDILVRSETDGYLKMPPVSKAPVPTGSEDGSSLEEALGSISVGQKVPSQDAKLEVRMQGTGISQDRIFDIKTRSTRTRFDMGEIFPRLWMNRTPRFLLAYHQDGVFTSPEVKDVRQDIDTWQDENASTLGRYHAVVKRIVDTVRDADTHQVEVSWDGTGPLLITKQIGEVRMALPAELHSHWEVV